MSSESTRDVKIPEAIPGSGLARLVAWFVLVGLFFAVAYVAIFFIFGPGEPLGFANTELHQWTRTEKLLLMVVIAVSMNCATVLYRVGLVEEVLKAIHHVAYPTMVASLIAEEQRKEVVKDLEELNKNSKETLAGIETLNEKLRR